MFVGWWIPFSWHSGILSVYGAKAKVDLSREEKRERREEGSVWIGGRTKEILVWDLGVGRVQKSA